MFQQSSGQNLEQAVLPTDAQTFNRLTTEKKSSSILIYFIESKVIYTEKMALIKTQWMIKNGMFLIRGRILIN